jgi:hypothetical protein
MNVARFVGGPLDDENRMVPDEAGWPLPDEFKMALVSDEGINFTIGYYDKTNQSQLSEAHPGILRGAEFEWREADEIDQ